MEVYLEGLVESVTDRIEGILNTIEEAGVSAEQAVVDGVRKVDEDIRQRAGATKDLLDNYIDMREQNVIGSDKYFHCKANCEAAQRGPAGKDVAEVIGLARELSDMAVKGDSEAECVADFTANQTGIAGGEDNPNADCSKVCGKYRVNGIPPNF